MRTVIQRVRRAEVTVDGSTVGKIGRGLLLLVAVQKGDTDEDVDATAQKVATMRVFPDRAPMDRSVVDIDGEVLVVSQFTLVGRLNKGRRPSFDRAEDPGRAERMVTALARRIEALNVPVQMGRFGANMQVELINDGPVTFHLVTVDGVVQP